MFNEPLIEPPLQAIIDFFFMNANGADVIVYSMYKILALYLSNKDRYKYWLISSDNTGQQIYR